MPQYKTRHSENDEVDFDGMSLRLDDQEIRDCLICYEPHSSDIFLLAKSKSSKKDTTLTQVVKGVGGVMDIEGEHGYAGKDGKEEVPDWDCEPFCPVELLDAQSGHTKSPKSHVKASSTYNKNAFGKGIGQEEGSVSINFGDEGGASRFFKQVQSEEELDRYLKSLIRSKS